MTASASPTLRDDELVIEQIAHRVLSGFYNDDPMTAARHIMRMDSMTLA